MTSALRATSGYLEGRLFLLPDDRELTVGTSLESDLVLFGEEVQRSHCSLRPNDDGTHRIETHSDATVTYGPSEVKFLELKDGDSVTIGENAFTYLCNVSRREENGHSDLILDRRLLARRDLADFRILRKVQMSEIDVTYMAVRAGQEERVAVRMFKTEHINNERMVERFLGRAMVGMALNHPRFAEVHSVGSMHGVCFVVSELVEDSLKLERFLRDRTPVEPDEALDFVKNLSETLRYARERKVIVGRRKPSGIYVLRDNRIKVSTFDLTRELNDAIIATAAFKDFLNSKFRFESRPELGAEYDKLDRLEREPKSLAEHPEEGVDIMYLGRTLYQLLTGSHFQAREATRLIIDGYGRNVPGPNGPRLERRGPLAEQPRDILMALARMVTADPKKRFDSLHEVEETVTQLLLDGF